MQMGKIEDYLADLLKILKALSLLSNYYPKCNMIQQQTAYWWTVQSASLMLMLTFWLYATVDYFEFHLNKAAPTYDLYLLNH